MKKKTPPKDVNENAFEILKAITGEPADISHDEKLAKKKNLPEKNPAAVALGRLGGLKGGKSRAAKLTKSRRIEIAKKAANKRWSQSK